MDRTEETDLARALRRLDVAGDMAAMDKQTLADLRAEAKAVVRPFARDVATLASNHAYNFAITLRGPNNEHLLTLLASDFEAARALLAKLGE